MDGIVYTETVVHAAPAQFAAEAPYQIAMVYMADGTRRTGRIFADAGQRVQIGDQVELMEERNGVPWFRIAAAP
jgi:uncharacterized OB-fold protein